MPPTAFELDDLVTIKVLIIEDDNNVGQILVDCLKHSNMQTAWAMTAAKGIELKKIFSPDVVLLDLNLPDCDGIDVVNYIGHWHDCGLIIVSGQTDEADRVVALELGADDYVVKPPVLRELVARIRAVNRRVKQRQGKPADLTPKPQSSIKAGTLTVDPVNHAVHGANGVRITVTSAEFMALKALIDAKGEIVPRDRLSVVALNHPWYPEDRSVDQLIYNLRRKLIAVADGTQIISVRGAGYLIPRPEAGLSKDSGPAHAWAGPASKLT